MSIHVRESILMWSLTGPNITTMNTYFGLLALSIVELDQVMSDAHNNLVQFVVTHGDKSKKGKQAISSLFRESNPRGGARTKCRSMATSPPVGNTSLSIINIHKHEYGGVFNNSQS